MTLTLLILLIRPYGSLDYVFAIDMELSGVFSMKSRH
jgi:hypothetical protein